MKKIISIRIILILLLVLWATLIFVMSSQPAVKSSQTSSKFVLKIIDIIHCDFDALPTQQQTAITHTYTFIVRKTAHFLEYFILGLLSSGVAVTYSSKKHNFSFIVSAVFCVFCAIGDEIHQYFVSGRACRFFDICIDSVGSIFAILFVVLIARVYKRRKLGEINEKKEIN